MWRGWDFKQAYEFLGGDTQYDLAEMKRLADERHAKAQAELEDKQRRVEAARKRITGSRETSLLSSKQWDSGRVTNGLRVD